MNKRTEYKPNNMMRAASRQQFIEANGNDGRFCQRFIEDKKKREDKRASREYKQLARQHSY